MAMDVKQQSEFNVAEAEEEWFKALLKMRF